MSKETVLYLLNKYKLKPDDTRGQNFLISDAIMDRIIAAADCTAKDRTLEIGPGVGTLTARLAIPGGIVGAVESDERFRPILDTLVAVNTNVRVLYADALRVPFEAIQRLLRIETNEPYKVVANIPYYITSRLIRTLIGFPQPPTLCVILLQREVAERIIAGPGDHSKLSLSIQFYGTPEIVAEVPKKNFYPQPKVDSAILRIRDVHSWAYPESEHLVWQLIAFGFSAKRKKLINNLMAGLQWTREDTAAMLKDAQIDLGLRAQNMSLQQWLGLSRAMQVRQKKATL